MLISDSKLHEFCFICIQYQFISRFAFKITHIHNYLDVVLLQPRKCDRQIKVQERSKSLI